MTAAKRRGRFRDGLFDQPVDDQPYDNPLDRACPWPPCKAAVGRPCTAINGRKQLRGYHDARKAST